MSENNEIEPGVYHGMSFDDYRAIDAVNHSALCKMETSPEAFLDALNGESSDTPAMKFGRAVHTAVLEPDLFVEEYAVYTGKARRGKDWVQFEMLNSNKEIITESEHAKIKELADSVLSHGPSAAILNNSAMEVTIVWNDEETGIKCKCRIDALGDVVADLKTTAAETAGEFVGAAYKYLYHTQMAFYNRGVLAAWQMEDNGQCADGTKIIAVQKGGLKKTFIVNVPEETIQAGDKQIAGWLEQVKECRESGEYAGLGDSEVDFTLPEWALTENEPVELVIGGKTVKI